MQSFNTTIPNIKQQEIIKVEKEEKNENYFTKSGQNSFSKSNLIEKMFINNQNSFYKKDENNYQSKNEITKQIVIKDKEIKVLDFEEFNLSIVKKSKIEEDEKIEELSENEEFSLKSSYFCNIEKKESFLTIQNKTIFQHNISKNTCSQFCFDNLQKNLNNIEVFSFEDLGNNSIFISGGIDSLHCEIVKFSFIINYELKKITSERDMKISRLFF